MISHSRTLKVLLLIAAFVTFDSVVALLSINQMSPPNPNSSAALGVDWQCSRSAFVFTTCIPSRDIETASIRPRSGR